MNEETDLSLLICVAVVATLLSVSTRQVYRLADANKIPRPLKIGGSVRWRRAELEQWIADGCPRVSRGAK